VSQNSFKLHTKNPIPAVAITAGCFLFIQLLLGFLESGWPFFLTLLAVFFFLATLYLVLGCYRKSCKETQWVQTYADRIDANNIGEIRPSAEQSAAPVFQTVLKLQERLAESLRKARQFSGDASHELRTPLTIIKGEAEVALRWGKNLEDYRNALTSCAEEAQRMERIIDDLLTLARSNAGQQALQFEPVSLMDLFHELYISIKTVAAADNIDFTPELSENILLIADELHLRRVLLNLVDNAIKYSPPKSQVRLSAKRIGEQVHIHVADNGPGIEAKHIPYIFDRFYRVDKARNRADGGTGLGLSIVKEIITAHGGEVSVHSDPGKGTTFHVILPLNADPSNQKPFED